MIISYEIANYKIYEDVYASSVGEGVALALLQSFTLWGMARTSVFVVFDLVKIHFSSTT